jgi:hypothetical protein
MIADPTVSVLMTTYNHERFIGQAIESVLMQQTKFPLEVVIGEDKSPDGTRRIAEDYQRRYPDEIHLLAREVNLGAHNFVETYRACRGKYVAVLEGDDYWTSPDKLQTQVEALEAHSDWVMCFHTVRCVSEDGSRPPFPNPPPNWQEVSTLDDLLEINFVPTCSVVFRNGIVGEFPKWYFSLPIGDWPFCIMLAQHGKLGYIDRVMADYRMHAGGAWTSKDEVVRKEAILEMFGQVRQLLDEERAARVTRKVVKGQIELMTDDMELGRRSKAQSRLWRLLRRESLLRRGYPRRLVLRTALEIDAPRVLRLIRWIRQHSRRGRKPGRTGGI